MAALDVDFHVPVGAWGSADPTERAAAASMSNTRKARTRGRGRARRLPVAGSGPVGLEAAFASIVWHAMRPGWTQSGWWDAHLRDEVRDVLWLPVGPDLMMALTALAARDRAARYECGVCPHDHAVASVEERVGAPGRPCACQVVVLAAWTALASWAGGQADGFFLEVAAPAPVQHLLVPDRPDLGTMTDPAVEELAPALRVSPGSARHRLAGLRRAARLPRLTAAVASGLVIGWHAHLLVTDLRHLPAGDRETVVDVLLDRLEQRRGTGLREWTLTDLRAQAKRIAARLDLDLAARRSECHRGRGVRLRLHGQGSATLSADLTDDDATRIFHRLTGLAHGLGSDCDGQEERSLEQRRADVFTDLLLGAPATPGSATPGSSGTGSAGSGSGRGGSGSGAGEVAVVIDAAALLRLADTPAELPGCGPIPAEVARELAADARWRAWITTTTSAGTQVVATSPGTYRPSAAVARLIRAREPECRMPGCRSRVTDLDHIVPFPKGATVLANLQPLCRRHHRLKTHTRWRLTTTGMSSDDDPDRPLPPDPGEPDPATYTWTSPTGITHTDHSEPPLL